jgi:hypothetical protein
MLKKERLICQVAVQEENSPLHIAEPIMLLNIILQKSFFRPP